MLVRAPAEHINRRGSIIRKMFHVDLNKLSADGMADSSILDVPICL